MSVVAGIVTNTTGIVTREALDEMASHCCSDPACTHDQMCLHSTCHPESGVHVSYKRSQGVLIIQCHECMNEITAIKVGVRYQ